MAAALTMPGRRRPEFGHGLRSTPHLGYLIFFRVSDATMEIVAIVHGGRDLPSAFQERADEN